MRYAHIVRRNAPGLTATTTAARKFRPINKRHRTAALDQSLRRSLPVVALLALPFLVALYQFIFHHHKPPASRSPSDSGTLPPIPSQFARFDNTVSPHTAAAAVAPASSSSSSASATLSANAAKNAVQPVAAASGTGTDPPSLVSVDYPTYFKLLATRRKFKVDPRASVTLIAACKDRTESLSLSLASWEAVPQIDHIVVVDWSSTDPPSWHNTVRMRGMATSGRLTLANVKGAGPWVLSRAYNLAASLASGSHLLKVDCDTHLNKNVLSGVSLPSASEYLSVPFESPRTQNEARLRGVFLVRTDVFHAAGGFDERITGYGYEDTDLYARFHSDLGLTVRSFNLDRLRHNLANHVVWHRNDSARLTRHLSTRLNQALLAELPRWRGLHAGLNGTYSLQIEPATGVLHATATRTAPDALAALPDAQRETLRVKMLRTALHDDFSLPWDVVPTLSRPDLEYLAWRLDAAEAESETPTRVVVAVLDGPSVLANVFNLVSAARLAIKLRRPVVVCWNRPSVRADNVVTRLLDMEASNTQLLAAAGGTAATDRSRVGPRGEGDVRLIAAGRWPCNEGLAHCAAQYDRAYGAFTEVVSDGQTVYDEQDETPVSSSRHAVVRLGTNVKIGNRAARAAIYKALVQGRIVREAQQRLGVVPRLAAVTTNASAEHGAEAVAAAARKHLGLGERDAVTTDAVTVVGDAATAARQLLFGHDHEASKGFCDGDSCSLDEVAREMASVLGSSVAAGVVPPLKVDNDRKAWLDGKDVTALMVEDLRALQQG